MGEDYVPVSGSKKEKYEHLLEEMEWRIEEGSHPESNRSNLVAILKA